MFSIVTPSLNQGRFIGDAIESVLAQAMPNVEHIVVDGGSTDETSDVLARYPHVVRLRDAGEGQSQAVNIGLRAASGHVIGWLNADDRYVPGAFNDVQHALAEHPDAGAVHGNAETIDETGAVIGELRAGPFDRDALLNGMNAIPQPAVFLRAEIFQTVGLLDESLHYVMDYELWLRASLVTRFMWIDATWAQFRKHADSKTIAQQGRFWPEMRAVARSYGGPYFSTRWRMQLKHRLIPHGVGELRRRISQ